MDSCSPGCFRTEPPVFRPDIPLELHPSGQRWRPHGLKSIDAPVELAERDVSRKTLRKLAPGAQQGASRTLVREG